MAAAVEEYEISTDRDRLDMDWLHNRMSTDTYWAPGRSRDRITQAVAHSRCYGVYDPHSGSQVAFARLVTDFTVIAWLGDVYVDRTVRGIGISKRLVTQILADVEPMGLRRIVLSTEDAHSLYRRFGFDDVEAGEWLQLLWPDNP